MWAYPHSCPSGFCCEALCPTGYRVTGGGASGQDVWVSYPLGTGGWYANFSITPANAASGAWCYAICCKFTPP
jgi:hypothetical protein